MSIILSRKLKYKALSLHGRGFICNRIGLHGAGRVRYQNWVVLNTLSKVERFQNDTVSLVV